MTRRSPGTSYKEKYENIRAIRSLTSSALEDAEHEKNEIISAGNRTQASINSSLHLINSLFDIPRNVQWVADENGVIIVQETTVIQHNQTLVADAQNVEQGIRVLGDVIRGYDRALEFLIQHVEELSESIRTRAMIGHRNLTDIEEPRGLRNADYPPQYEVPPPPFDSPPIASSSNVSDTNIPSSGLVVPLNSSASVFSAFGAISRPQTVHTPLFVNANI